MSIIDNVIPEIVLVEPLDGALITGGSVNLKADYGDSDNSITQVYFYESSNPNPLSSDPSPPYSCDWTPPGDGNFTLRAKVYDNGQEKLSDPVNITIDYIEEDYVKLPIFSAAASDYQDGHPPGDTIDGDLSTRWSASGDGQWIEYDLESTTTVGYVKIAWFKGDQRMAAFDIEVSSDGIDWSQVYSGQSNGTTLNLQSYDFNDLTARYVRIVGHGNTENDWNSITEVEIYDR
jgi:hypothetical protein